jgi:deazaflavin-dependent oxidoreductase (nitroreductase family)
MLFWRLVNPLNRTLAARAPWWVVLETTGRRTGKPRQTPLARGSSDTDATWVISVHGHAADWVRNLEADPNVRVRVRGRWHNALASAHPFDPAIVRRFNRYARAGPRFMAIEPLLVRIDFKQPASASSGATAPLSQPARQRLKRRISRSIERRLVNPFVRRLVSAGKLGSTYAILETTGRRTGLPRRTPVANGLRGDTFWLISAHGPHAGYFKNLLADPKVRIGLARDRQLHWRAGTAEPLWHDDTIQRQRQLAQGRLGYRLDAVILRSTATRLTTVRIALEPTGS